MHLTYRVNIYFILFFIMFCTIVTSSHSKLAPVIWANFMRIVLNVNRLKQPKKKRKTTKHHNPLHSNGSIRIAQPVLFRSKNCYLIVSYERLSVSFYSGSRVHVLLSAVRARHVRWASLTCTRDTTGDIKLNVNFK